MLEVYKVRSVEWRPTAVVALATSVDQTQVAVAREDASIEIWIVAPGSVGWHCQVTIPGRDGCLISSLVWCHSSSCLPGRLFSASLDGSITEWDLYTLQAKATVSVLGGSIWQMSAEPFQEKHISKSWTSQISDDDESRSSSSTEGSDDEETDDHLDGKATRKRKDVSQQVAVACHDGAVRIYVVQDSVEGMEYYRSFPRVEGKVLSVAWNTDAKTLFAGSSNGCIRCWDVVTSNEVFRITAGHGGVGDGRDLCIWSLLVLQGGVLVSGDSAGFVQFWDIHQGTLLQQQSYHKGDVLALATTPNHKGIFSAGADGQVVHYKYTCEMNLGNNTSLENADDTRGKWIFVGRKRVHTHDVKALTVAVPLIAETGNLLDNFEKKSGDRTYKAVDYLKWARPGVPMLISGGEDTKLFAYPADNFLDFRPHDICPAPQRVIVHLARRPRDKECPIMMTQHSTWLDVSMITLTRKDIDIGKRKTRDFEYENHHSKQKKETLMGQQGRGKSLDSTGYSNGNEKRLTQYIPGSLSKPLVRIECKSSRRIICSALSESGHLIAFSDQKKPALYELRSKHLTESQVNSTEWVVKKKHLPHGLLSAHSMVFSADSTRLIVASCCGKIHVVSIESVEILHTFGPSATEGEVLEASPPITKLCTSADGQWLVAINCFGDIDVSNLEILRQHWHLSRSDAITAAGFHPSNKNVLVVTTSSNHVYGLDVEAKQLGEWSKRYASGLPRRFLEFPGGIIGLSFPPSQNATSVIVHSSRAMCLIDFGMPVKQEEGVSVSGRLHATDVRKASWVNGNGNHKTKSILKDQNFVIKSFDNPVLFLTHLSDHSVLVVEKRWVDVLQNFRAPVYRHIYGT